MDSEVAFPAEIYILILTYVIDIGLKMRMARVCRRFRSYVANQASWKNCVLPIPVFQAIPVYRRRKALSFFLNCAGNSIIGIESPVTFREPPQFQTEMLTELFAKLPAFKIRILTLTRLPGRCICPKYCNHFVVWCLSTFRSSLRAIDMEACEYGCRTVMTLSEALLYSSQLQSVVLRDITSFHVPMLKRLLLSKTVKSLTLTGFGTYNEIEGPITLINCRLANILNRTAPGHLRRLTLEGDVGLVDLADTLVLRAAGSLEFGHFELRDPSELEGVLVLLPKAPNLRELSLDIHILQSAARMTCILPNMLEFFGRLLASDFTPKITMQIKKYGEVVGVAGPAPAVFGGELYRSLNSLLSAEHLPENFNPSNWSQTFQSERRTLCVKYELCEADAVL